MDRINNFENELRSIIKSFECAFILNRSHVACYGCCAYHGLIEVKVHNIYYL